MNRGGYTDIVSFILGITFEIWERRQVERILDYYGEDIDVFSLEGLTRGASSMVEQTRATLKAFPDRLLLGDDVVWCGDLSRGFSSHRITSPMTNLGATSFGPATGRRVLTMNIADCEITDGRITREWLLRDNLALISQLGFDPQTIAREMAERMDSPTRDWLSREYSRVSGSPAEPCRTIGEPETDPAEAFARRILQACWCGGDREFIASAYAPYCVLHRAPVRIISGRDALLRHYAEWRGAFPGVRLSLDHVCSQPFNRRGTQLAARWSIAGLHKGPFGPLAASGRPLYAVGVTHWRVLNERIISEWTVFDEIAMMAQLLDPES
jgi:predicted ester cyclase